MNSSSSLPSKKKVRGRRKKATPAHATSSEQPEVPASDHDAEPSLIDSIPFTEQDAAETGESMTEGESVADQDNADQDNAEQGDADQDDSASAESTDGDLIADGAAGDGATAVGDTAVDDTAVDDVIVDNATVDPGESPDETPGDDAPVDDVAAPAPDQETPAAEDESGDETVADEAAATALEPELSAETAGEDGPAAVEELPRDEAAPPSGGDEVGTDADSELDVVAGVTERIQLEDIQPEQTSEVDALQLRGVTKRYGDTYAVDSIDLTVPTGSFYGLVGPNGAGKTTTLSLIAGLLTAERGSITVAGIDVGTDPVAAKRVMGVLPDRLRTFDRLTGRQLLYYYGVLRGLAPAVAESRASDLASAFDFAGDLGRRVSDYSFGMTKKIMLAGAMIHSPRVLVLDEPFESVDPVSSGVMIDILTGYVHNGGTVLLSSHGMDFVERVCSRVAVIASGSVIADGTVDEVRGEAHTLEERFLELVGGSAARKGLEWLHTFSGSD